MAQVNVDIEVLRTEIGALRTNVSEVGAKMDMLLSMQVQLVGLQKDIEHTRASVDRAFDGLRTAKELAVSTDNKLSKAISAGRGAGLVGAVLFAFAQWYMLEQLQAIKDTSASVVAVERRLHYIEAKVWPDVAGGRP
jgi:phage shock protein A